MKVVIQHQPHRKMLIIYKPDISNISNELITQGIDLDSEEYALSDITVYPHI